MTIGRIPSVEGGIQPTIVDAKGDLIAATAADTVNRLAVGSNDQVLVADSAASTGLAWKSYGAQFVAGKNKIINGDFGVWQRGTSFSNPVATSYLADRFRLYYDQTGATITVSQQTFTPGAAPVAGYESQYFFRLAVSVAGTGGTELNMGQRVEDARTLANQTVTFSFWAKADSAITITPQFQFSFGSGGSTAVLLSSSSVTISTSWARYSATVAFPSVNGKTIGAGSFVYARLLLPNNAAFTIDTWGWQLEAGSTATPFTTATGTIQGELAACQRYYYRWEPTAGGQFGAGFSQSTTATAILVQFPQTMRIAPTALEQSGTAGDYSVFNSNGATACTAVPTFGNGTTNTSRVGLTTGATMTTGDGAFGRAVNTSAYLAWSAEL
jgi:hypothetical protein